MTIEGDRHNFGQFVRRVERASGVYFQKPRPIYWEWLFFGKTSPLAPFFEMKERASLDPRVVLFNLETEMGADDCGFSREVAAATDETVTLGHAYSFGVLLAYCYVFGIRDLHRHNVVRTSTHLQVVDAEVVLVKLLLPHETLLLPFKDIGPGSAASSHLGAAPGELSLEMVREILLGYCDVFECFRKHESAIAALFSSRREEMTKVPIRHITRDTAQYRQWKEAAPEIPFFDAELVQLERGDVPYFFKFLSDPKLYAFANPVGATKAVNVPWALQRAVDRDACDPLNLLAAGRVQKMGLPIGLMFLGKTLLKGGSEESVSLQEHMVRIDKGAVSFLKSGSVYRQS